MSKLFLVTGAGGHLGNTVVRLLSEAGQNTRCLLLCGESDKPLEDLNCEIFYGDVRDKSSLSDFFSVQDGVEMIVIHCAGIVSITSKHNKAIYEVNVTGTKNIADLSLKANVSKLVYVSSVHAIPELEKGCLISEIDHFDPSNVEGEYAKTKSEATQYVLDKVREGLNASVVHPSGIIGPYDFTRNHLTQLILDFAKGRLTAGVRGGYDFVDVRDVAAGILEAAERGQPGECFILSNRYISVSALLKELSMILRRKEIKVFLPMWFAKITAPFAELYYKILRQKPLYTRYSLHALTSNAKFNNQKAKDELGYQPRDLKITLNDTVQWLINNHILLLKKNTVDSI